MQDLCQFWVEKYLLMTENINEKQINIRLAAYFKKKWGRLESR